MAAALQASAARPVHPEALNAILTEFGLPPRWHAEIAAKVADILRVYRQVPATPIDALCAQALRAASACLNGAPIPSAEAITAIGTEFDHLGREAGIQSLIGAVNLAARSCIAPSLGYAVVATARNEGPFLIQWIAHQRAIGIEAIFLYTNDNSDGSDALLTALAEHGYIRLVRNETSRIVNPQVKAYEHLLAFGLPLRAFAWTMVLDCDEFPVLDPTDDFMIAPFVAQATRARDGGRPADAICLNWLWYGSNGHVRAGPEPLSERFTVAATFSHFVKSVSRTSTVMSLQNVHKPRLFCGHHAVNSAGETVDLAGFECPSDYTKGWINHYWNKSFEEFLVKSSRGHDRPTFVRDTSRFFEWDIADAPANHRPMPADLRARAEAEYRAIMAREAIRAAHQTVMETYGSLVRRLQREASIETLYAREKACMDIMRYLDAS